MNAITRISGADLDVIRRTIAKDTNGAEFDLYIAASQRYGLDPFRRQIIPMIFSKNDPKKRQMTLILTRDGYRCIASRCGNYRPKCKPAIFVCDKDLKSPLNPAGIVSVGVELYWQDRQGRWHPVYGEAYWEEYVPIERIWDDDERSGRRKSTGEKLPDMWAKMPRNMIEKCAESQALRAGWPEEFSGLYGEEEMAKAVVEELTASEMAERARIDRERKSIQHKDSIAFNFGEGIQFIPAGKVYDRWQEAIRKHRDHPAVILTLREQNRESLKEFWLYDKNATLELRKQLDAIEEASKREHIDG